jgi:hypothetical protein
MRVAVQKVKDIRKGGGATARKVRDVARMCNLRLVRCSLLRGAKPKKSARDDIDQR